MSLVASAQRFAHALAQYEDELAARAKELNACAERFSKPGFKPSAGGSSGELAWFDELESIREALANHKTQVDQTARLDTLSDLGEAAAKGLELALQQLEDLASIKYGYVKTEATPGRPRRAGAPPLSPMQSPSALSDPPTPKSDDLMLSNAARSLLGARAVPQ